MAGDVAFYADTSFWVAASTTVFVGLVWWKGGFKAVGSVLDAKIEKIRLDIDEANNLRKESEKMLSDLRRQQRDAEATAADIQKLAQEEARIAIVEADKAIDEMVARKTRLAEEKIAQVEAQAVKEVRDMAAKIAVDAASEVLADRLAGKEGGKLIDDAISDIDQRLH